MFYYFLLIIVGFCAGFINTVAGGGSLLSLPILIFMGLPPSVANGTNRIAIGIQSIIATKGFKSKNISTFPFNIYLGIAALGGSIIGAMIAVDIKGKTFNKILSIIMILILLIIIFKPKLKTSNLQERITGKYLWIGIISFFFLGIYGGFINVGIGFFITLFLNYINRMNFIRANATKVVVVLTYTLSAIIIFAFNNKINWKLGLILAIGNGIGAWVSSRISVKKGEGFVKKFMVAMLLIIAIKLWFF